MRKLLKSTSRAITKQVVPQGGPIHATDLESAAESAAPWVLLDLFSTPTPGRQMA